MYLENPPLELWLVRHAESERNHIKGKDVYFKDDGSRDTVRGIPDHLIPLSANGFAQAKILGKKLATSWSAPDVLIHSGYLRAHQTLEAVKSAYFITTAKTIPVRMNELVRERSPGYTYDMTEHEAITAFPWQAENWRTFGGFIARPPGGESLLEVADRLKPFLQMDLREFTGQIVLVFTHGGVMRACRFLLEDQTYEQAKSWGPEGPAENCSIDRYKWDTTGKLTQIQHNLRIF